MKSNDQQYLSAGRSMADEIRDSHKTLSGLWQGISLFSNSKAWSITGKISQTRELPLTRFRISAKQGIIPDIKNKQMDQIINSRS